MARARGTPRQRGLFQAGTDFMPAPAPPLWGPAGELLLPDLVRLISLNQPYADLLFGDDGEPGPKGLETRMWLWPYEPSWLAIYATKTPDKPALKRLHDRLTQVQRIGPHGRPYESPRDLCLGAVIGIVFIGGCRPMVPGDEKAALYPHKAGRFVWIIGANHRLARPIRLPRGPQKFASLPRQTIAVALDAPAGGRT